MPAKKKGGKGKGKAPEEKGISIDEFKDELKKIFKASEVPDNEQHQFYRFIDDEIERREKDTQPLKFVLSGNISASTICSLCEALEVAWQKKFKLVNVICLSNLEVAEKGAEALARCVQRVESISRIDLRCTLLTPLSCEPLGLALQKSAHLQKLNLSYNKIRSEGFMHLVRGLASNNSLQELTLSFCGLEEDSSLALMQTIKGCKSLKALKLNGNRLKTRGLQGACQAIVNSGSGLDKLDFSLNGVGENLEDENPTLISCMHDVAEVLRSSALSTLDLGGNCFSESFGEVLLEAYEQGKVAEFKLPHNWGNVKLYKSFATIASKRGGKKKKKKKGGKKKKKK